MKVRVLKVTTTDKNYNVVHVQCGNMYGDCLATQDVTEPGEYELRSSLQVKQGRLVPMIRVEPLQA